MNRALQPLVFDELTAAAVLRTGTSGLRVGACRVEPDLDRVTGPVGESTLEPKAMAVLVYLAARPGQVISADALIDAIWLGRPLGDNPVYKCIAQLRRALGDDPKAPTYIATVPKKGYRLIAPVTRLDAGDGGERADAMAPPDIAAALPRKPTPRLLGVAALALLGLSALLATTLQTTVPGANQAVTGSEQPLADAGAATPEAYAAYVKAHYYWTRRSPEQLPKARDLLAQAVAVDPRFAAAWVDLGLVSMAMSHYGQQTWREGLLQAAEAAHRALVLAPDRAPTYVLHAAVLEREWNWRAAERTYRRAIAINPKDVTAWYWYGRLLERMGRLDEARPALQRAQELAPISLIIGRASADPDFYAGDYARASEQYLRLLELDPAFSSARLYLGYVYEQQGRYADAIAQFRQAIADGERLPALAAIGHAQALAGQTDAARRTLAELAQAGPDVDPYYRALIHVGLGEPDAAFRALDAAYAAHSNGMLDIAIDPRLAPLRADPRYRNLIERMALAH